MHSYIKDECILIVILWYLIISGPVSYISVSSACILVTCTQQCICGDLLDDSFRWVEEGVEVGLRCLHLSLGPT